MDKMIEFKIIFLNKSIFLLKFKRHFHGLNIFYPNLPNILQIRKREKQTFLVNLPYIIMFFLKGINRAVYLFIKSKHPFFNFH